MLTQGQCQRSRDQPVKAQRSSVPFTQAVQLLADTPLVVSAFCLICFTWILFSPSLFEHWVPGPNWGHQGCNYTPLSQVWSLLRRGLGFLLLWQLVLLQIKVEFAATFNGTGVGSWSTLHSYVVKHNAAWGITAFEREWCLPLILNLHPTLKERKMPSQKS